MTDVIRRLHGVPVLVCAPGGARLSGERDALDLIGDAGYRGAAWVVVPVARLDERFFRLRSGLAGEIAQKFANYGMGLAILGDVSRHVAASTALRDFVRECDRGRRLWFVADLDEFGRRLAATVPTGT